MSLTSVILSFAPAIAARFKREEPDRETERLKGRITQLLAEAADALEERDALRAEVQRAYRMVDQARLHYQVSAVHQAQQAQLCLQAQAMQNPQAAIPGVWHDVCNCVPARHDMLLGGIGDGT